MRSVKRLSTGWKIVSNCTSLLVVIGSLFASSTVLAAPPVLDAGCVLDQPTAPNGLNCTANDTTLSSPSITIIDPCSYPGDTAILNVTVDITIGAQTRYDLAVWVATDGDPNGDGAATGECAVLSVANNLLHVDGITSTLGDGDACGDIFNVDPVPPNPLITAHLLGADLGSFPLDCVDNDGDGKLDVPVIISWKQQADNDCSVSNEAVPGTAAKCVEDLTFALDIPIPGRIIVDKVTLPSDATDFQFHLTGPASGVPGGFDGSVDFLLNDASDPFDTADIEGGVLAGIYSVTEDADPAYVTSATCTGSEGSEDPAAIDLAAGETVTCVFTNTLDSATINVVKNTLGSNGLFTVNWAGPTTSGGVVLDTGVINTDSDVIVTTETGTFTLQELIPAGWDLASAACVNDNGGASVGTWDQVDTINGILLAPGGSITCTFTNAAAGSVTLIKNTIGGDGSFDFVTDLTEGGVNIQTSNGSGAANFTGVGAGVYSIVETVPAGWNLDSASCNDGSPPNALDISEGESVTCTFTNTKLGTVIVEKQTLPDGSLQSFEFTGNIGGNIVDGGQIVLPGLLPATYTSTETSVGGWNLTSIVCDDGNSSGDTGTATATFNLEAGETVTCVFNNTQDGSIEVVKSLAATGPAVELFGFTSDFNGAFNLQGDAATTGPIAVTPGSGYNVSEDDPTVNGWANIGAICTGGDNPNVNITVSPGEAVLCTFTNAPLGSATIIKNSIGGDDIFDFTGDPPFDGLQLTTVAGTASQDFTFELNADTYLITEAPIPAGWSLTGLGCVEDGLQDSTVLIPTATMNVELAETVTCTFTNTADGTLIIRKETLPDAAAQAFTFTGDAAGDIHDYSNTLEELTVSGLPGIYTSAETVPAGWEITDISCTGDVQSGVTIGDADVSVDLAAGETVICTFENSAQGSITIEKLTQGDVGLFSFNGDFGSFQLDTNNANPDSSTFSALLPGTYMVSEIVPANWTLSDISCSGQTNSTITIGGANGFDPGDQGVTIDLVSGEKIVCTFTNGAWATIAVAKQTLPDGSPQSFNFTGEFSTTLMDNQTSSVRRPAGQYSVTEAALAGWDLTSINCGESNSSGDVPSRTANFDVTWGEIASCTFTNTQQGTITLVKNLPNDNGGDAVETDFTAFIDANPVPWGVAQALVPGDYTASETTLQGYEPSGWFNACAANGTVTLGAGENLICEITNDDVAPTLTLVKTVINDNGGLLTQSDFPSFVNGVPQAWDVVTAVEANTLLTATETQQLGYVPSAWGGDCAADGTITLLLGDVKTCTITNDDSSAQINLAKSSGSTVFVSGSTWEVVYTITATNAGEGPGVYDVMDTMMPGDGITPEIDAFYPALVYAGGETQTGVLTAPPLANGGTWVTLEGLAGLASESWTVTARFTVDEQFLASNPGAGDCVLEDNEQGTGYFNYVEGSATDEDLSDNETCVPHPLPSTPVPTLSAWAMLLMILLMTGAAGWYFRPVQMRRTS